jgi:flagellar basal-body rod protein FlgB
VIDRILFSTRSLAATKQALDVYAARGRVHARNVANAETPGYRAQEVRFEDDLRLALRTTGEGRLARTQERHLPARGDLPDGRIVARNPGGPWSANGVNDVEIDREMAEIARNTERYTVAAEMVRRAYEGLRKAIHGRPGV